MCARGCPHVEIKGLLGGADSLSAMWVLRIKLKTPGLAADTSTYQAISPRYSLDLQVGVIGPQTLSLHSCRALRSDPPWDWLSPTDILRSSLYTWEGCSCSTQVWASPRIHIQPLTAEETPRESLGSSWFHGGSCGHLAPHHPRDRVLICSTFVQGLLASTRESSGLGKIVLIPLLWVHDLFCCLESPCLMESQEGSAGWSAHL